MRRANATKPDFLTTIPYFLDELAPKIPLSVCYATTFDPICKFHLLEQKFGTKCFCRRTNIKVARGIFEPDTAAAILLGALVP